MDNYNTNKIIYNNDDENNLTKVMFIIFITIIFKIINIIEDIQHKVNNVILISNKHRPINYVSCSCQTTCSICLNNIINRNNKTITKCGHVFHTDCYTEFLLKTKYTHIKCPLCRDTLYINYNTHNEVNNTDDEDIDDGDENMEDQDEDMEDQDEDNNNDLDNDNNVNTPEESNINTHDNQNMTEVYV